VPGVPPACGKALAGEAPGDEARRGAPRSVAAMLLRRDDLELLPKGMPTGPWETKALAHADINTFCMNTKTDGGGYAVVWGSSNAGSTKRGWARGQQCMLACHKHAPPYRCKWKLWLEECAEGWAIWSFKGHDVCVPHNHELAQSRAEANAHTAMRSIPDHLLPVAKSLVAASVSVEDVWRWLKRTVETEGGEVTFNYMDVYHATGASTAERALDATNLTEMLRQREQDHGLFYRTTTDGEGCLKNVFFAMHGAHETYAVDAKHQVVVFDTKVRRRRRRCCPLRCGGRRRHHYRHRRRRRCRAAAPPCRRRRAAAPPRRRIVVLRDCGPMTPYLPHASN
jgi:hypothetical protein